MIRVWVVTEDLRAEALVAILFGNDMVMRIVLRGLPWRGIHHVGNRPARGRGFFDGLPSADLFLIMLANP